MVWVLVVHFLIAGQWYHKTIEFDPPIRKRGACEIIRQDIERTKPAAVEQIVTRCVQELEA